MNHMSPRDETAWPLRKVHIPYIPVGCMQIAEATSAVALPCPALPYPALPCPALPRALLATGPMASHRTLVLVLLGGGRCQGSCRALHQHMPLFCSKELAPATSRGPSWVLVLVLVLVSLVLVSLVLVLVLALVLVLVLVRARAVGMAWPGRYAMVWVAVTAVQPVLTLRPFLFECVTRQTDFHEPVHPPPPCRTSCSLPFRRR